MIIISFTDGKVEAQRDEKYAQGRALDCMVGLGFKPRFLWHRVSNHCGITSDFDSRTLLFIRLTPGIKYAPGTNIWLQKTQLFGRQ